MAPNESDPRPDRADDVLRLDHALKLAGVADTGGHAKQLIQEGSVRVNGEVETRRKRKLVEGDVVEVGEESFEIALSDDGEDEDEVGTDAEAAANEAALVADAAAEDDEATDDPGEADALELTPADLDRWAAWVIERMAEDDGEAVILRLGSLHPDALEALFARLPADVEDAVLDVLDEVLERTDHDVFGDGSRRDGPMEA